MIVKISLKMTQFKGFWTKWHWRCRSRSPIFNRCWKLSKIHILCKIGPIPINSFWLIARTSQNWQNSKFSRAEWPWRCRSRSPIINRCRKLGRINMHTKFGNIPSNGFWLNARTSQIYRRADTPSAERQRGNKKSLTHMYYIHALTHQHSLLYWHYLHGWHGKYIWTYFTIMLIFIVELVISVWLLFRTVHIHGPHREFIWAVNQANGFIVGQAQLGPIKRKPCTPTL